MAVSFDESIPSVDNHKLYVWFDRNILDGLYHWTKLWVGYLVRRRFQVQFLLRFSILKMSRCIIQFDHMRCSMLSFGICDAAASTQKQNKKKQVADILSTNRFWTIFNDHHCAIVWSCDIGFIILCRCRQRIQNELPFYRLVNDHFVAQTQIIIPKISPNDHSKRSFQVIIKEISRTNKFNGNWFNAIVIRKEPHLDQNATMLRHSTSKSAKYFPTDCYSNIQSQIWKNRIISLIIYLSPLRHFLHVICNDVRQMMWGVWALRTHRERSMMDLGFVVIPTSFARLCHFKGNKNNNE